MDSLRASGNRGGWRVASQRRPDGRFITLRYGRHRIGPRRYFSVLLLRFRIVALIPFLTVIVQFGVQFGKSGRFRCQFFLLGEGARRFFLALPAILSSALLMRITFPKGSSASSAV